MSRSHRRPTAPDRPGLAPTPGRRAAGRRAGAGILSGGWGGAVAVTRGRLHPRRLHGCSAVPQPALADGAALSRSSRTWVLPGRRGGGRQTAARSRVRPRSLAYRVEKRGTNTLPIPHAAGVIISCDVEPPPTGPGAREIAERANDCHRQDPARGRTCRSGSSGAGSHLISCEARFVPVDPPRGRSRPARVGLRSLPYVRADRPRIPHRAPEAPPHRLSGRAARACLPRRSRRRSIPSPASPSSPRARPRSPRAHALGAFLAFSPALCYDAASS